jgi:glyoxylase-like metal-dependent hydrolase (beta-lactamase superfamily II)
VEPADSSLFLVCELDFGRLRIERRGGGRLLLPVAPCLLRQSERVVLVDAGFDAGLAERVPGVEWLRPPRDLAAQLEALGLRPDDVSDVVLTHLHDDHASGVLDHAGGGAAYPNARLHVQELALWRGFERVARGGERFVSFELLEWLDEWPLTVRHHGDWRLCEGIAVYHTGGHTPGHQAVLAGGGALERRAAEALEYRPAGGDPTRATDDLLLAGDLLSLKACFDPAFRTSSDVEPGRALARRQDLAAAARAGLNCYLYHGSPGRRIWRPLD